MSAINVNSITGRTGTHGPVLTGVTTVSGDLNVTGKVSIAGTISYEDVTEIDSVGIITARSGINVTGGDVTIDGTVSSAWTFDKSTNALVFKDNIIAKFGTDEDLKIYHDGSNSYIDEVGTGALFVRGSTDLKLSTNGSVRLRINSAGNVGIGTDNPAVISGMSKYLTLSSKTVDHAVGFELQGNRTGSDQTVGRISFINNTNEIARINVDSSSGGTNGNLTVTTSGTEVLRITNDGNVNNLKNVGVQTSYPTSSTLVGAASSLIGLYIGDGHMLFSDNLSRSGGYYIPNGLNALNAGPVTLGSTMTLDGVWVIV